MSFFKTVGSSIGAGAAYAGHGCIRAASMTGQAGADLVAGTREGYADKSAELAARRALLSQAAPLKVTLKPRTAKA